MPQPFSTLKGFGVTFRQIFRKPITQQYPEYKRPGCADFGQVLFYLRTAG